MDRQIKTDVLVIGAGNAGLFAAIKAAEEGAAVTLVDKGFAGKSGQSQNMETMIVFDPERHDLPAVRRPPDKRQCGLGQRSSSSPEARRRALWRRRSGEMSPGSRVFL